MKARRLIFGVLWFNLLAASATAETIVIRPDPCPAPANAPKFVMFLDPEVEESAADEAFADNVVVYFAAPSSGWASARLLARFDIEGEDRRSHRARTCGR